MNDTIRIQGARENNLKNVDLTIPRDKLVVFTGLSGSGKSSLAFDTIYAEGQRRYVESLSSYARQFLGQMDKPDVDSIDGLSPAISIDQKTTSKNPRSTVVPSRKCTTICVCSGPEWAFPTVPSAARRSIARPLIRLSTGWKPWERAPASWFCLPSSGAKRANTRRFLKTRKNPALPVSAWMASFTT